MFLFCLMMHKILKPKTQRVHTFFLSWLYLTFQREYSKGCEHIQPLCKSNLRIWHINISQAYGRFDGDMTMKWKRWTNITLAKTKAIKTNCVSAQHFAFFFLACWKERTPLSAFIESSVKFSKRYMWHKSKKTNNTWVILDCTEDTMDEDTALSFSWEPPLKSRGKRQGERKRNQLW